MARSHFGFGGIMRTKFLSTSSIVALAVVAAASTPAFAQATDAATAAPAPVKVAQAAQTKPTIVQDDAEPIVVTGTRIARPEFSRPNPIQSFNAESIKDVGATNITDFLLRSPALIGSVTSSNTAGSNLASAQLAGVNELNLRNLGNQRTLVLVDGRRHVAAEQGRPRLIPTAFRST